MELQNINRLAVFKMRNIGDVLMMTPALRALRETFPKARITAVVNSGTEAMLAHNPHIDEVLVFQRPDKKSGFLTRLRYELGFVNQLRQRKFDLTIGFTDGDRPSWYTRFCHARYRVGLIHYSRGKNDPRRRIYNMLAPSSPPLMHEVEKHFYILDQAGLKLKSTKSQNLCLVIPDDLRKWAVKELAPLRPAKIIHIHPVSRWLWKCWGNGAMARVIDWLQTERGTRVVLTTGPVARERKKAQEIVLLCRTRPLFYDGNLSLSQIAALSAVSDGYFGVDTAPMHMAAAVGVPVIALFGPTNPVSWGPWTPLARVLSQPCLCEGGQTPPCSWDADKVRHCLARISVEQAQAALNEVLDRPATT
jgi:heptosyltransferase-3